MPRSHFHPHPADNLGLSSEDKTEKPSSENQLQSDYMEVDGILTKTEKGSFSVHDGLMYFTDYETQTSIPVCGKPNCRHLSVYEDEKTTCNAVCSSSYMFPYKEKLYRIESVDNREGKLIASHMDGSNPKTVGTFSSGDMLESAVILKRICTIPTVNYKIKSWRNRKTDRRKADRQWDLIVR